MVVKRRKKSARQEGHSTHGWGRNKHRHSGNRTGFGMAGTGKKCDAKKSMIWKDLDYFGKHGFVKKGITTNDITINLKEIDERIPTWLENKQATKESNVIVIDLEKIGYTKVLGTGKLNHKVKLTIPKAAKNAIEKIKTAGGELTVKE